MQGGRYFFTSRAAAEALGGSKDAVKLALNRLRHKGEIASPVRGSYVVVPPEYRALGCLPADQFIPALMQNTGTPYYAGLLSAAQHSLAELSPTVPLPWTQRLGYLLERIDEAPRARALKDFVQQRARESIPLLPSARAEDQPRDRGWKLIVNAEVEAEG